jgi:hypothetical protein
MANKLAELLRLNDGEQAYVGYPQMQVGLNKPRQTGYATGFLENATGLPPMQSQGVLTNPNYDAYAQGQNTGEAVNIGAMAVPAAFMAKTLRTAKPVQAASTLDPIGQRLQHRLDNDYENLVKKYNLLEDAKGGKVFNTDIARELSPEYMKNRTLSAAVHEPSSALIKKMYAERLAQPTPQGVSPVVMFTGGGTGAGKTSAIKKLGLDKDVEMIYDTNMNKLDSATNKINQALESGRNVKIVYTYRDPVEALTGGSLPRAVRMAEKHGSGRTVPMEEHKKTHVGSREVAGQLQEMYKDNPNVAIDVIDNSRGAGNQVLTTLDKIPQVNDNELLSKLNKALEGEYAGKRIPMDIYEGSK